MTILVISSSPNLREIDPQPYVLVWDVKSSGRRGAYVPRVIWFRGSHMHMKTPISPPPERCRGICGREYSW